MAAPRRDDPGLTGQPKDWEVDPSTGQYQGYHHRLPESPTTGWIRRNFTLGNLIVMITMLVAAGAWLRSAETAGITMDARVQQAERRLDKLQQDTISKELLAARLDTIAERLKSIEERLSKIERVK